MPFQSAGDLGHLHQAEHALLHSRASGRANHQQGQFVLGRPFDQTRDLFANHRSHGPAHEPEIHNGQGHGHAFHAAEARDNTIFETGRRLALLQAIGIGPSILEPQRVRWSKGIIETLKAARIGNHSDALVTADPIVVAAVGADAGVGP